MYRYRKKRAIAPAKLILTGEYSVLYDKPALAMAVDLYTESLISWRSIPAICFNLIDLEYATTNTIQALKKIKQRLQKDYMDFLKGNLQITEVIKRPFELLQFSVASIIEHLNLKIPKGLEIKVNSNIPIGCGMGSSAACLVSTICALLDWFKLEIDHKKYLLFGQEAENLQHGKSSGLDVHLSTLGGILKYQSGQVKQHYLPENLPKFKIINTGTPECTTGESIEKVRPIFEKSKTLSDDFASVTQQIDNSIQNNNLDSLREGIRLNNYLLNKIGVVPEKVFNFIKEIETYNISAKTCGSGSVKGDNAGIVMLSIPEESLNINPILEKYNFKLQDINIDEYGCRTI